MYYKHRLFMGACCISCEVLYLSVSPLATQLTLADPTSAAYRAVADAVAASETAARLFRRASQQHLQSQPDYVLRASTSHVHELVSVRCDVS